MTHKTITQHEFEKQFNEYYLTLKKPSGIDGFMGNWAWYNDAKNKFKKQLEKEGIMVK